MILLSTLKPLHDAKISFNLKIAINHFNQRMRHATEHKIAHRSILKTKENENFKETQ